MSTTIIATLVSMTMNLLAPGESFQVLWSGPLYSSVANLSTLVTMSWAWLGILRNNLTTAVTSCSWTTRGWWQSSAPRPT